MLWLSFFTLDVSYTKTERTRYTGAQTLPVSITLVGCYSSDERLIDCAYHDFPSDSTISMDVSISCQGSSDDSEISHLRRVSTASLTLTVLLAIAAIVVVVVLVVIFVLRQRKKRYDPR